MGLCTFYVQDRDYTRGEVVALLNNASYKHHLLSGNQHWYSTGTSLETVGKAFEVFSKATAAILGAFGTYQDIKSIKKATWDGDSEELGERMFHGTMHKNAQLLNYASQPLSGDLSGTREFNIFQLQGNDKYSGREITKLLVELHNDRLSFFVKNTNDIISDFANHKFQSANVATTENHSWWEYAILDTQNTVADELVKDFVTENQEV